MQAGSSSGLRYTLHIGKAPTNTVKEIKVSGTNDDDQGADEEKDAGDEKDADEETTDTESENEDEGAGGSNRYVLIRVGFDDSLLNGPGEKPVAPTEPTKPEGYTPLAEGDESQDADSDSDQADGEDADDEDAAPKPSEVKRNVAFDKYDADLAAYEEALVDYEVDISAYEKATQEKETQAEIGKKKAKILNERFEKWYYVVSSENLKTLRSGRADVTEPVAATTPQGQPAVGAGMLKPMTDRPDVSFPVVNIEETKDASDVEDSAPVEKPAVDKPSVEKPNIDNEAQEESSENGDTKMEETADSVEEQVDSEPETEQEKDEETELGE